MHVRLLIPDLFPPGKAYMTLLAERRFPSLETFVARGRRSAGEWHSIEQWLLEFFSVERQQDWPSAPFALLGERGAPGEGYWMHAEPVHLRPEMDRVRLADASLLNISPAEADSIARRLTQHFAPAMEVRVLQEKRWYARLAAPPADPTLPVRAVADQAIDPASASLRWHALMNEIQMLLHDDPVNSAREARGEPAINGIWLWGGGRLAAATPPPLRSLLAELPLALGLASSVGLRASFPPDDVALWLQGVDREGVHLAVLSSLCEPVRRGETAPWAAELERLEHRWFAPLFSALRSGHIDMVTLQLASETAVLNAEATRSDLRHFWRVRRPLAHYCADR